MKGLFNLNSSNVKSAIVYGLLTLGVTFLLSAAESVMKAGSIWGVNWHNVVNDGAMAVLPVFVTCISVLKNILTTTDGKFLGMVTVIPDKDN